MGFIYNEENRKGALWNPRWVVGVQMNVFQALVGLLSGLIHNYWAFVLLRSTFVILPIIGLHTCRLAQVGNPPKLT